MHTRVFRKGRTFYHGSQHGPLVEIVRNEPFWMTTRIRTAADFGLEVSRVVVLRPLNMLEMRLSEWWGWAKEELGFDGPVDMSAGPFCDWAELGGFYDGWHIPDAWGDGESDTMVCRPVGRVAVQAVLSEAQVDRAL